MVKQKQPTHKFYFIVALIAVIVLILDQLTKYLVRLKQPFATEGFLSITFTQNTGTFFGLFDSAAGSNILFIILSIVAIAALIFFIKSEQRTTALIPLGFIIGGILGNFLDRVLLGYVVDWIRLPFWPIFNIADIALVGGVFIVLYITIKDELLEEKHHNIKKQKRVTKKQ